MYQNALWLLLLLKLLLFPLRWGSLPSQKTLPHWLPFSSQPPQKSATPLLTQQRLSRGSTLPPLPGYNDEPRTLQWGGLREGQVESWDFHPYRAVMIPHPPWSVQTEPWLATPLSSRRCLSLSPLRWYQGRPRGVRTLTSPVVTRPLPTWCQQRIHREWYSHIHLLVGVWSDPHYKTTVIKTVVLTFRQQNRSESRNKHKHQWPTDLGWEYQSHSKGLSTVFSKNGVGWPDNHVGNKEAGTQHLPPYIKMNSTWINHLSITAKTKPLGENAGAKLNNLGFSNGLLNRISEAKAVT